MTRILASLALVLGLAGCDVGEFPIEGAEPDGGGGGTLPLAFNGSISQDVQLCVACHGPALQEGGYRVDTYAGIVGLGGDAIANVIPGDINSLLITEMDPLLAPRIEHTAYATDIRKQLYVDWITAGAPENPVGGVIDAGI